MSDTVRRYETIGERKMHAIPHYGNYGGPNYGHGEWRGDEYVRIEPAETPTANGNDKK